MKTVITEDATVTYDDSNTKAREVFEMVTDWLFKQKCFSGESMIQSDDSQLEVSELFCDLIDDVYQFDVVWEEE